MYLNARKSGVYIQSEDVFEQTQDSDMTNVKEILTASFIMVEQEAKRARSRSIRKQY
jgi:hypothetical protein